MNMNWYDHALCRGRDTSEFFREQDVLGRPKAETNYSQELRDLCDRCPVMGRCLSHALAYEDFGFWAGTTPRQRQHMRRERGYRSVS